MRPLEFRRQFSRIKILADVRQSLFQLVQRVGEVLLVRDGDVAPHGIGRAGDAGQIAQRASADVEQRGVGAEFVDQRRGQRGGDHLRQMADPGAEAIMLGGIEERDAGAHFFDAVQKFSAQAGVRVLAREAA